MKLFFTLSIYLSFFTITFSSTFYVATTGVDTGSGTISDPFASIQKAHDVAQAGDTIYVRGGEYFPTSQTIFSKKGNSNAYVVLSAYPDEIPIINGGNLPEGNISHGSVVTWNFDGAEYWKILGPLKITNGRGAGIIISGCDFIEFDFIESSYNGKTASRAAHGFMIWTGTNITFKNCDAHHNANHLWKSTEDQEGNQYQHGDGWRIFSGNNIKLTGCRSWQNLDDNYDFYGADNSIDFIDCWSAYAGIDDSLGSITGIPNKAMPRIDGSNLLWGNGVKLGYDQDNVNHYVVRCITWGNNAAGFHMNLGPSTILNSISYSNRAFGLDFTDGNKHEIKNSWEFSNNYDNPDYPEVIPDLSISTHNSWDNTINISLSDEDFISIDDASMFAPRNADGDLPNASFLRLASNSDLIDAGTDAGLTYFGAAPDIGALEFDGIPSSVDDYLAQEISDEFTLASYPNPFNPSTTITYNLPVASKVSLSVFDVTGREIAELDHGYRERGVHKSVWNARDNNNNEVATGVYFIVINSISYRKSFKVMYLK